MVKDFTKFFNKNRFNKILLGLYLVLIIPGSILLGRGIHLRFVNLIMLEINPGPSPINGLAVGRNTTGIQSPNLKLFIYIEGNESENIKQICYRIFYSHILYDSKLGEKFWLNLNLKMKYILH